MIKDILANLALIDLTNFCKANNIDCSGTHLIKEPRKYIYALMKDKTNKPLVQVRFNKSSTPSHFIHN